MKLNFPAGVAGFVDDAGTRWMPDANNQVDIGGAAPDQFLTAGFTFAVPLSTTATRPTVGLTPGMFAFDSTLGKPIWRNAANTGWVDATGASV